MKLKKDGKEVLSFSFSFLFFSRRAYYINADRKISRAVDFACCIREENSEDSKETKEEQGGQPTDKKEIP